MSNDECRTRRNEGESSLPVSPHTLAAMKRWFATLGWSFLLSLSVSGQHATTNEVPFAEAMQDARRLQLAPGFKLDVWAAEPQLSNGVAFSFRAVPAADSKAAPGIECYVAESHRWS